MKKLDDKIKIRDHFAGSKQIDVPARILENSIKVHPLISNLYLKNIGYYPHAQFHHRLWKKGCPENILIYCLNGSGWFKRKNLLQTISKNQFILIASEAESISYGANEDDPWTIYWIHFTGSALTDFNHTYNERTNKVTNIIFDQQRVDIWKEMYSWLSAGYSLENLCKSNFLLPHFISTFLYAQFMEVGDLENQLVKDIIKYLQSNIEKCITTESISKIFNVSGSHMRMLFKKITEIPLNEYLINLRIQKSSNLLINSNLRISEICHQTGFSDPYYFSRCFKRETGLSPMLYRKQYR